MNETNQNVTYFFSQLYGDVTQTSIKDPFYSVHCELGLKNTLNDFELRDNQILVVENLEIPKFPFFKEDKETIKKKWQQRIAAIDIYEVVKPLNDTYFKVGFKKDQKGNEIYWNGCKAFETDKITPIDFPGYVLKDFNRASAKLHRVPCSMNNYYNYKHQRCIEKNPQNFFAPSIDDNLIWEKEKKFQSHNPPRHGPGTLRMSDYGKKYMDADTNKEYFAINKEEFKKLKTYSCKTIQKPTNATSAIQYADSSDKNKGIWINLQKFKDNLFVDANETKNGFSFGMMNSKDKPFTINITNNTTQKPLETGPMTIDPGKYCYYILYKNTLKQRCLLPLYDRDITSFNYVYNWFHQNHYAKYVSEWNTRYMDLKTQRCTPINIYFNDVSKTLPKTQHPTIVLRDRYIWSNVINMQDRNPFHPANPFGIAIFSYDYTKDAYATDDYDIMFYTQQISSLNEGDKIQFWLPREAALDYLSLLLLVKNNTSYHAKNSGATSFNQSLEFDCWCYNKTTTIQQNGLKNALYDTKTKTVTDEEWFQFNGCFKGAGKETKKFKKQIETDPSKIDLNDFYLIEITYKPYLVPTKNKFYVCETLYDEQRWDTQPTYFTYWTFALDRQTYLNQNNMRYLDPSRFKRKPTTPKNYIEDENGFAFKSHSIAVHELNKHYLVPYLENLVKDNQLNKYTYFQHYYPTQKDTDIVFRFLPNSRRIGVHCDDLQNEPFTFGDIQTFKTETKKVMDIKQYYDLKSTSPFSDINYTKEYFKKQDWLNDRHYEVPSQNEILLLYCSQARDSTFATDKGSEFSKFPYLFTTVVNYQDNPYHKKIMKDVDYLRLTNYDFKDQKNNTNTFNNFASIEKLEFYLTKFDGSFVEQIPGKVLPFKNFIFTIKRNEKLLKRKRKLSRKMSNLTKGKTERFIAISSRDNNAVFDIRFQDVQNIKQLLNITKANEGSLKYVRLDLLSLTIPVQTDDVKKTNQFMYIGTNLIETALNTKQTYTYVINGVKKNVLAMFNLGYFKESKETDDNFPVYYKKPIYFNAATSDIKSNPIYLDNLNTLLDSQFDIKYLENDEKVVFKSTTTTNQIEYTLTAYFDNSKR